MLNNHKKVMLKKTSVGEMKTSTLLINKKIQRCILYSFHEKGELKLSSRSPNTLKELTLTTGESNVCGYSSYIIT